MTPRKQFDGRTRRGKAYRAGYRHGHTAAAPSPLGRAMPEWDAYEEGFATGRAERAKGELYVAELARLRKDGK